MHLLIAHSEHRIRWNSSNRGSRMYFIDRNILFVEFLGHDAHGNWKRDKLPTTIYWPDRIKLENSRRMFPGPSNPIMRTLFWCHKNRTNKQTTESQHPRTGEWWTKPAIKMTLPMLPVVSRVGILLQSENSATVNHSVLISEPGKWQDTIIKHKPIQQGQHSGTNQVDRFS